MRKLTKKALSLVLCLMLVVSAISGAFSISATTIGSTTVKGNPVYDAPINLDFSEGTTGLKYWVLGESQKGNKNLIVEDGVLKAGPGLLDYDNGWQETGPARFKIPNAQVGDVVRVRYDFNINLDNIVSYDAEGAVDETATQALKDRVTGGERVLYIIVRHYDAAGNKITDQQLDLTANTQGTKVSKGFTLNSSDDFFRIIICSAKGLKDAWEVSNIAVLKRIQEDSKDNTNGAMDSPFFDYGGRAYSYYTYVNGAESVGFANFDGSLEGGSEETGYTYTSKTNIDKPYADNLAVIEAPKNLDFKSGLKYWASYLFANSTEKGASAADEVESVENGVVTLKAKDRNNAGLITQKFMTGIKAGEKLYITAEYKPVAGDEEKVIDPKLRFRAWQTGCYKRQGMYWAYNGLSADNKYEQKEDLEGSTYTTVVNENDGWLRLTISYTAVADDEYYQVMFGYGENTAALEDIAQLQFRNINVFKDTGDVYLDMATNQEYTKSPLMPIGGSEEEGIPAIDFGGPTPVIVGQDGNTYYIDNIEKFGINEKGLENADFSQGFKNWTPFRYFPKLAASAKLSGIASVENGVVTINANTTFDDGSAFTSEGLGLASQTFKIPGLKEGDKLIMTIDAASGSTIRGALGEYKTEALDGLNYRQNEVETNNTSAIVNSAYELWVTPELTVTDPNAYFMVTLRNKNYNKDASFKNVRIYKVTEDNNLVDVTKGYTDGAAAVNANGGTAEYGMLVARNTSNVYYNTDITTTNILNGDFSDGLKYWRLGKARRGTADYIASVVDGALNLVSNNSGNNENATLRTNKLNLDAVAGSLVTLSADVTKPGLGVYAKVYEDGVEIKKASIWAAGTLVLADVEIKKGSLYEFEFAIESYANGSQNGKVTVIDNVCILAKDGGGLENAPLINVDGTLVEGDLYGDANYDGKVNLLDLVRIKKNLTEGTEIFFAAVDADKDGDLDGDDFVDVVAWVIEASK